ncbi:hypothetical protein R3W88_014786 [Solanum pinnatisectum]|uniref:CCHC-type domain-containing protein n=1 Tax=Solanum pinnatisectum TaxID=50273 RepID=A0AAV9KTF1_9SOLN|nr:hypothetical protein R3W88_014786 [Solanum pinnatisectum]
MPPRRAFRGRLARRNVEEQELPNAPEVQPHREVTNAEFRKTIRMLSQVVTNQYGQQRRARQEVADTFTIREFLRINPPSFTGSTTTEDPKNFIMELKKVFEVMHVADTERAFLRHFFPRELKEAKVREFLTLNKDYMSVHEYGLKFTKLSRYAPKMVVDMRSRMSLFVAGLAHLSSKEGRAAMLIGDMDISSQNFRAKPIYSQGSMAQGGSKPPACTKCGRDHSGTCREDSTSCFKCGQNGHFMREYLMNK